MTEYPGLLRWWHETFSKEERDYILNRFKPTILGGSEKWKPEIDNIIKLDGSPNVRFDTLAGPVYRKIGWPCPTLHS